jgi:hypothetical protein
VNTNYIRRGALAVVSAALVVLSSAQADTRNLKVAKTPDAAATDKRIALVIGNGNYASSPLRNPANDARAVSAALKDLGFDVIHHENLGLKAMGKTIREFGNKLKDSGGVGLFYYAGHGMQVKGRNYLIPVDADIQNEDEIAFNALDANIVLEKIDTANNRLNLVILDACRNNPFARSFRSGNQGLAQMDAPRRNWSRRRRRPSSDSCARKRSPGTKPTMKKTGSFSSWSTTRLPPARNVDRRQR